VLAEVARTAASAGDARWRRLAAAAIEHSPREGPRLLETIGRDLMSQSRVEEATEANSWGLRLVRDDPPEHLRLLGRFVHTIRANVERPDDHLELVDQLADAIDAYPDRDTPEWRQAAAFLAYQRAITVSTKAEVDALVKEALDPARVTEREVPEGIPIFTGIQAAGQVGSEAEAWGIDLALRVGTQLGSSAHVQVALAYRGGRLLREGRIDEAEADFTRAARHRPLVPLTLPKLQSELAQVLLEQGRADEAMTALESVDPEIFRTTGFYNAYLRARGLVRAADGELDLALQDLLACGEREAMILVPGAIAIPWAFDAALVLVELDRRDEAASLLAEPLRAAHRQGAPFRVAHGLRALAATQPDDEAEATLRAAIEVLDGTVWDLERRSVEIALAKVLLRLGDRGPARELLRGVIDRAHRVGAARIGQAALEALRGSGARPRRLAVTGEEALTRGERAVVKLAVDGLTNSEIAAVRGVTVKAVEHALSNAYRKLGVRSRHELGRLS
jgi:DNA-binding CsgD family transcriptional regulator